MMQVDCLGLNSNENTSLTIQTDITPLFKAWIEMESKRESTPKGSVHFFSFPPE